MEKIGRNYGFLFGIDIFATGSRDELCLAWKEGLSVNLRSFSRNHVDVVVDGALSSETWRFTGFYGSPYERDKYLTWGLLRQLGQFQDLPWLVCRDFNEILYASEKSGGVLKDA